MHLLEEYNVLLTSWIHTRIPNGQSLKYNRLSKSSWKIYENIALRFKREKNLEASSWFLLRLCNPKTSHTFLNWSSTIFNTRLRDQSSTHDFCVLPLQICKVKCDWFIRADVTEIVLAARVHRCYFRRRQATAGNRFAFAGYTWMEKRKMWKITCLSQWHDIWHTLT